MTRHPESIADFVGPSKPSGQHICYKHCPMCGADDWKLYLAPDSGLWKCFAGRHNAGGRVDVGQSGSGYEQGQALMDLLSGWEETVEWGEIELPEWEPLSRSAQRYLIGRGIYEHLQRKLGLVEWTDKFRIIIPYFDRAGNMVYYNSRRYSEHAGSGPSYITAEGRHPLYEVDWRREQAYWRGYRSPTRARDLVQSVVEAIYPNPPVLVEGVFDAWAVAAAGYHAIALGGKSLPDYLRQDLLTLTAGCDMIVVMLDDEALAAAYRIRDQISDQRQVKIVPLLPGQDPGSMEPQEIREAIQ